MLIKKHLAVILIFISSSILAQVSNVEGIEPMDGVEIPKVQISRPQAAKSGAVFKDCDVCPEMVVIPAGSFWMGSPPDPEPDSEPDPFSNAKPVKVGKDNEKPQHRVDIQSFAIGKYEVTQEQWYAVMGNNPSKNKGRTLPIVNVSWNDVQLFVQKLSRKTGKKYRLTSEAEWEYAARGGSDATYPWGNSDTELHVYAWFSAIANATNPVGLKKPNQFGLYDMLGNVWEWTQDCWHEDYFGAPRHGQAWTTGEDCSKRVLRGGSWDDDPQGLRVAFRFSYSYAVGYFFYDIGFRVARDL
jgi:formylglycine-generating enzyme required for sulfatase activity